MVSSSLILDRAAQQLTLHGRTYTGDELKQLIQERHTLDLTPELSDLYAFLESWFEPSDTLMVQTSGSTGVPKMIHVSKARMMQSACLTCEFLGLHRGQTALLCMNLRYIGAMMMVVRALICELNLLVRPASGQPLLTITEPIDFAAMVPLQVYNALQEPQTYEVLQSIHRLIIGGGSVPATVEETLRTFPNAIYSTYGMTETLSHIALKQLNGSQASGRYTPFRSVNLTLSEQGTLLIDAPLVCDTPLVTNDLARLYADGTFEILGRADNTINSGGVKIQIESMESILQHHLSVPFAVSAVPDVKLGEAVVLLVALTPTTDVAQLRLQLTDLLPPYHGPKEIFGVDEIPLTETGKTDRARCRQLAFQLWKDKKR